MVKIITMIILMLITSISFGKDIYGVVNGENITSLDIEKVEEDKKFIANEGTRLATTIITKYSVLDDASKKDFLNEIVDEILIYQHIKKTINYKTEEYNELLGEAKKFIQDYNYRNSDYPKIIKGMEKHIAVLLWGYNEKDRIEKDVTIQDVNNLRQKIERNSSRKLKKEKAIEIIVKEQFSLFKLRLISRLRDQSKIEIYP